MFFAGLALAISLLGSTPQALGLPTSFWCDDFVGLATGEPPSINSLINKGDVPFEAVPGGVVGINSEYSTPDYAFHVAVIEKVTTDGGVDVIEGNGADPGHVTRNHYAQNRITKTYITRTEHEEYEHGLCLQLQEVKPWIDWSC